MGDNSMGGSAKVNFNHTEGSKSTSVQEQDMALGARLEIAFTEDSQDQYSIEV